MRRHVSWLSVLPLSAGIGCGGSSGGGRSSSPMIGDEPAITTHLDEAKIESGEVPIEDAVAQGEKLFTASFNTLDGAGRPETTGTGVPRDRREFPQNFNRISAPDSN